MYDFAIIGAGINGSFMAYRLHKAGKRVLLLDPKGIGGSGSQAAGAFLSPKVGKGGYLKSLVNTAYQEAILFYQKHASDFFTQQGLLHYPQTQEEAETLFPLYKKHSDIPFDQPDESLTDLLVDKELAHEGLFFKDAGIIDPLKLCRYLTQDIAFLNQMVEHIEFHDNHWSVDDQKAEHVILATGGFEFFHEAYITLRPVWGERIEIESDIKIPTNYHKKISISATEKQGRCVIGATHEQHITEKELSLDAANKLITQAKSMIGFEKSNIIDHRGGVRAGSFDYIPLLGDLVDSKEMLKCYPALLNGAQPKDVDWHTYKHLSIINGVGGRGFVLAPYLSRLLCESLLEGKDIPQELLTYRLFNRWVKRLKKEKMEKNENQ